MIQLLMSNLRTFCVSYLFSSLRPISSPAESLEEMDENCPALPQVERLQWNLTPSLRKAILTAGNNVDQ